MAMNFPTPLRKGDVAALIAPSSPIPIEKTRECIRLLELAGLQVKKGNSLNPTANYHNYLAGTGKMRAMDINGMFADPEVRAIFCLRGGYGSSKVIDYLDLELIRANPKIFVGYSDITNIHTVLQQNCNMVTFHGPMVYPNFCRSDDSYSLKSLKQAFNLKAGEELAFENPPGLLPIKALTGGMAQGILTGGNLSVLTKAVGTRYQIQPSGKILFLEDVNESIPKVDMMLTQLEHAGVMDNIRGILLGNFTDCTNKEYDPQFTQEDFFKERFAKYEIPILYNIYSGHEVPMGTLPFGVICRINADTGSIKFYREDGA